MLKKIGSIVVLILIMTQCVVEAADTFRLCRTPGGDYSEIADQLLALGSAQAPITILDLSDTQFPDLKEVLNVFRHTTSDQQARMQELRMSKAYGRSFSKREEHQAICDTIVKKFKELKRLDMSHNFLCLERLCEGEYGGLVYDLSHLKALRFTHNQIGETDPSALSFYGVLSTVVEDGNHALEYVDISNNESNAEMNIQEIVTKGLLPQSKLRVLNFSGNHLNLEDTEKWVKILSSTEHPFMFVDLTHNLVSEAKKQAFAKAYRTKIKTAPEKNWPVIRINARNAAGIYGADVIVGSASSFRALSQVYEEGNPDWWWAPNAEKAKEYSNEAIITACDWLVSQCLIQINGWPNGALNVGVMDHQPFMSKVDSLKIVWNLTLSDVESVQRGKLVAYVAANPGQLGADIRKSFLKSLTPAEQKSRLVFTALQLAMGNHTVTPANIVEETLRTVM